MLFSRPLLVLVIGTLLGASCLRAPPMPSLSPMSPVAGSADTRGSVALAGNFAEDAFAGFFSGEMEGRVALPRRWSLGMRGTYAPFGNRQAGGGLLSARHLWDPRPGFRTGLDLAVGGGVFDPGAQWVWKTSNDGAGHYEFDGSISAKYSKPPPNLPYGNAAVGWIAGRKLGDWFEFSGGVYLAGSMGFYRAKILGQTQDLGWWGQAGVQPVFALTVAPRPTGFYAMLNGQYFLAMSPYPPYLFSGFSLGLVGGYRL